jgi:hypothetical protein
VIAVDANAIIAYLDEQPDDELRFVFESNPSELALQIGRQVIGETAWSSVNRPGLRWQSMQEMVTLGKLQLFGAETMLRGVDLAEFRRLRELLVASAASQADSRVLAHSLFFRLLLFTKERRLKIGITNALRNRQLSAFLTGQGLATVYEDIIAE